jgi:hypothetical protein
MDNALPPGWEKDSATLYLHETGVRIEKRVYREKEGWILIPVDLDTPVTEFSPDKEGLAAAFAAWTKGAAKTKVKPAPKATAKAKAKKKKAEEEEGETPKAASEDGEEGEEPAEKEEAEDDDD